MHARSLGRVYFIDEENPSNIIPNTTFRVDIPIEQMAQDALVSAFPNAMQLVEGAVPTLVHNTLPALVAAEGPRVMPALVDQAWPYVQQRLVQEAPAIAQALGPTIEQVIDQHVEHAWQRVKPSVDASIQQAVTAAEKAAAVGLAITTGAVLLGGFALGRKMRWW